MKLKHLFVRQYTDELHLWVIWTVLLGLVAGGFFALVSSQSYGCNRVCTANGDESAYHWTTNCYCKDAKGFYNPKDGR